MIEALGIAMVKNEADVIEAFVRHNLGFMDALAIVDDRRSRDRRRVATPDGFINIWREPW